MNCLSHIKSLGSPQKILPVEFLDQWRAFLIREVLQRNAHRLWNGHVKHSAVATSGRSTGRLVCHGDEATERNETPYDSLYKLDGFNTDPQYGARMFKKKPRVVFVTDKNLKEPRFFFTVLGKYLEDQHGGMEKRLFIYWLNHIVQINCDFDWYGMFIYEEAM